ncbi:putative alpha-fucosidase A [Termitomyces sp. T112]|nr:putative alpha-fucosidase A [Termitomyces sp. T112]
MKLELLLSNVEYIMWEFFGFPYILSVYRTIEMWATRLLAFAQLVTLSISVPPGFPSSGNGLWFNTSANVWAKEWLPVGNGYLAAMVPGGTTYEATQLNIESLWSGGPFSDPSYNGGNKQPNDQLSTAQVMDDIRQQIFQSPTGDISSISQLTTEPGSYGAYAGAGYLISLMNSTGTVSNYGRYLDFDQGIARTIWTQLGTTYVRTTICSHPTQSCTQHITTSVSQRTVPTLPDLSYSFSSRQETGLPAPNITCLDSNTLQIRGTIEPSGGMIYEILARLQTVPVSDQSETTQCIQYPVASGFPANATLQVKAGTSREAWISWVGDTEYSMDGGNSEFGYSFRGSDPHNALLGLISSPTLDTSSFSSILSQHVADYKAALTDKFSLSLGQTPRLDVPTDVIKAAYQIDVGDRYLEWLLFNYGRYMLVSSARGLLPANLQGKWANGYSNAWSADYHSNINIQMNYWAAEMTNLDVTIPLFNYFEKTWAPRGAYTAQVLYNISRGWVTHNEMNIFGHTGMKGPGDTASWANYPESNVWMMLHVWDHFDYTNDISWWRSQGWPLIKGVASFHLDKLIPDLYFNDSTLVVNPCNSPKQPLMTFGCSHAQQLIWQLFNAVEKGFDASGDTDTAFLAEVKAKRAQMDKGIHIGSWGQLQEWKVDRDSPTDTHRHLSHLIGLYPGYAITGYDPSIQGKFTNRQVIDAATVSLIHRGNGTGPDADSGWEKAWRAAAWAQLGNATEFYHELSYAIDRNFGPSLLSLFNPSDPDPIFQIDANLGYSGALLNALFQAPDVANYSIPLRVTLLPALPKQWPSGSITGARLRGGLTLDLRWKNGEPVSASFKADANVVSRNVLVLCRGKTLASFETSSGLTISISSF